MTKEIIYVVDPMCSWCWGFSPAINSLLEQFSDQVPVKLMVGGLMPDLSNKLDADSKSDIRQHWEHVTELTGQPFCFDFFDREDFVYNTEPACRAVVAARTLDLEKVFPYLERLHQAFYTENQDITAPPTLLALAEECGFEGNAFAAAFNAKETMEETFRDFRTSRQMNVRGFPSLLLRDDDDYAFLTVGYQPLENLAPVIEVWIKDERPAREQFKTG